MFVLLYSCEEVSYKEEVLIVGCLKVVMASSKGPKVSIAFTSSPNNKKVVALKVLGRITNIQQHMLGFVFESYVVNIYRIL